LRGLGFYEAVGTVAAAGLAAVAAPQMISLGEDDIGTFVIELPGLGDERLLVVNPEIGGWTHILLPLRLRWL
jgi:hypothetical protein